MEFQSQTADNERVITLPDKADEAILSGPWPSIWRNPASAAPAASFLPVIHQELRNFGVSLFALLDECSGDLAQANDRCGRTESCAKVRGVSPLNQKTNPGGYPGFRLKVGGASEGPLASCSYLSKGRPYSDGADGGHAKRRHLIVASFFNLRPL